VEAAPANLCPQCGRAKPPGRWDELCPACVARFSFGFDADGEDDPAAEGSTDAGTSSSFPKFGDYELVEEIGRGGMGIVYRARQVSLKRWVAVKMIPFGPLAGPEAVRRFRTEAEAVAQLHHPNIIAIHEIGEQDGQHFFSMDYVGSGTLQERLREGPMAAKPAAQLLQTIARAIHYAHQRGILHRDVKPSNILLDEQEQPRISDFGLARQLSADSTLTVTGQMLGSPSYMPPEQASPRRTEPSPRSDVYSLGAMFYHMLTGRPPFQADTVEALLNQLLHHEPVALRLLTPGLPRDLETLCLKCLEKEPARRCASAQELADELGRFLRDEPIRAQPVGVVERGWRWCRRKPALAATLGLLCLVGVIGATGVLLEWRRAEAAVDTTRHNLYAADLELAYRAFAGQDLGHARQLLERHRPDPSRGQPDLRGWEWRYLWQQCHGDEWRSLGRHDSAVVGLACSSRGLLASADAQGNLQIRQLNARAAPILVTNLSSGRISSVAFSPDGSRLAHTTARGGIWVWATEHWHCLALLPHPAATHLAFSPDGRLLATANGTDVRLWAMDEWREWKRIPSNRARPEPRLVAFAPDNKTLAIADGTGSIIFWDFRTDTEMKGWRAHRPAPDWEGTVEALAFAPAQPLLASAGGDRTIRLWTAPPNYRWLTNHTEAVMSIAYSRDGRRLVSGSMDQTVRLWDVATQRELASWQGHAGGCLQVQFAPDGLSFASGGVDGELKLWNLQPKRSGSTSQPLPPKTRDAVLHPQRNWLSIATATATNQGYRVWSLPTFQELYRADGLTNADLSLKSIAHGRLVEWTGAVIQVRNITNGELSTTITSPDGEVVSVDLARDGTTMAVSAIDGITVWDIPSGRILRRWATLKSGQGRHIRITPDAAKVITLQRFDGTVTFLQVKNGHQSALPGRLIGASVLSLSSDGALLATAGLGASLRLYDVQREKEVGPLETTRGYVTALAFAPGGTRIAGGTSKGPIVIWDLTTRREVAWLAGHQSLIYSLAFLDTETLASVTRDEVRLWNAAVER
jgi:WD40 repeat protein